MDLTKTIEAKSDQLNADDLLGGPKTIKITKVSLVSGDQPVLIHYEGDNKKPFKPSKSMMRVLIKGWGSDGDKYAGRTMTLYNDPTVKWAGQEVGGIRISHMSDLDGTLRMAIALTRGKKIPYTVLPWKEIAEKTLEEKIEACIDALEKAGIKLDDEQTLKLESVKDATELKVIYKTLTDKKT